MIIAALLCSTGLIQLDSKIHCSGDMVRRLQSHCPPEGEEWAKWTHGAVARVAFKAAPTLPPRGGGVGGWVPGRRAFFRENVLPPGGGGVDGWVGGLVGTPGARRSRKFLNFP